MDQWRITKRQAGFSLMGILMMAIAGSVVMWMALSVNKMTVEGLKKSQAKHGDFTVHASQIMRLKKFLSMAHTITTGADANGSFTQLNLHLKEMVGANTVLTPYEVRLYSLADCPGNTRATPQPCLLISKKTGITPANKTYIQGIKSIQWCFPGSPCTITDVVFPPAAYESANRIVMKINYRDGKDLIYVAKQMNVLPEEKYSQRDIHFIR